MKIKNEETNTSSQEESIICETDKTTHVNLNKSLIDSARLNEKQSKEFNLKYRLVTKLESGISPSTLLADYSDKLSELGLKGSVRWLYKIHYRYKSKGVSGLLDQRANNSSARRLLTPDVEEVILIFWYLRPAAGPKAIWELTRDACTERNIACPGYDTVKKFLKNQPEHHKLVREGKIRIWDKESRAVVRIENTSRANERWQADHCELPIWIKEKKNGIWIPCLVYLSAFMDAHTRAIPGIWLSKRHPDSWTILILLRYAILSKSHLKWLVQGIPRIIQPDRGADWMSRTIALSVGYLGITYDPDYPYYPNGKGKLERWFETLNIGLLVKLPGHKNAIGKSYTSAQRHIAELLELHELRDEITKFIVETHHEREHSETKRKPAEFWLDTVELRMPDSETALDEMLLKSDQTRVAKNTGIDFTFDNHKGRYWSPMLMSFGKKEMQIRYNPEDLDSILLYSIDKHEFLCEAFLMGQEDSRYTIEDVKRERNQFRRGLLERQKLYVKKIEEYDRPRREKIQKEKTENLIKRASSKKTIKEKSSPYEGALNLLEQLERRGRGES